MKAADIVLGKCYYARVSGALAVVRVVMKREPDRFHRGTRYQLQRVKTGQILSKWRSAHSLRPLKSNVSHILEVETP